jgi:hypothetical protein
MNRTRNVYPLPDKPSVLPEGHPALVHAKTRFPKSVRFARRGDQVLKPGEYNSKIGDMTQKGFRRGAPIVCLTLEERTTCSRTCLLWDSCYGNNMHRSTRYRDSPLMRMIIREEVELLSSDYQKGFLVRLHILGDFKSVTYVNFWDALLSEFPAMHVWGFTERKPGTPVGDSIQRMIRRHGWTRCALRVSGGTDAKRCSRVISKTDATTVDQFTVCPVELGRLRNCAACGICWRSQKSIAFLKH